MKTRNVSDRPVFVLVLACLPMEAMPVTHDRSPGGASPPLSSRELLPLVRGASRSFYLSIRFLPPATRDTVALAYAIARAADTVADARVLPPSRRTDFLRSLSHRLQGDDPRTVPELPPDLEQRGASLAEIRLLRALPRLVSRLGRLPSLELVLGRRVLTILIEGMLFDLERFGPGKLGALVTPVELERYAYLVAGCVGEFWAGLHAARLGDCEELVSPPARSQAIRLGQGLQLVNILRDLPRDLKQGRCYLPKNQLRGLGLRPEDLLRPRTSRILRPLLERWLERARRHLAAGERFLRRIPGSESRLRLCTAWPLLLGLKTIRKLRRGIGDLLEPGLRIKVRRREVYRLLAVSALRVRESEGLERLIQRELGLAGGPNAETRS